MNYLNAAIAFAVTMFMLSIVTGIVVETIHRLWSMREKGLQRMMGRFYQVVISPLLINRDGLTQNLFVETMTVNRPSSAAAPKAPPVAAPGQVQPPAGGTSVAGIRKFASLDWWLGRADWAIDGSRLQSLSVVEFMSRLGTSDFAKQLPQPSGTMPDPVMADIEHKYQQFSAEASAHFEKRARLLSVLSAFAVAAVLYVNPLQIWNVYSTDHETALKVISLMDSAEKDFETPTGGAQPSAQDQEAMDILLDAKRRLVTEVATLTTAGAPLGWKDDKFMCFLPLWQSDVCITYTRTSRLVDLMAVLFGGLLVGLGAPFWHDLFKSLSGLRDLISPPASKQEGRAQVALANTQGHSDAHKAFNVAKAAAEAKTQK